ncbi:MAG TPA: glycine--tRNA ligase subunit beta [Thermoanaerobaculia bacterium]|nr:glycine--tRNA ligase subunit beta [Thermoanaerobaculia bacterium]
MAEYVFELLTEEIPAWMHESARAALGERLAALVGSLGVAEPAGSVMVSTTPRRIAVYLSKLPQREADREQEVKGPPRTSAYDPAGKPSPALTGFLKKNAASLEDILPATDEYVRIRRKIEGRPIEELIGQRMPEIIETLRWPKTMRLGDGEHSFIRPVHSIVSIFDGRHVPIRILGVASGTTTAGHRTLAPQRFEVSSYDDYVSKLELARVVVDPVRRRDVMAARAQTLSHEVGGSAALDASIWSQWQYLTEYPGVVRAEFRSEYLVLPEEVLVTVMRVHQKQLPIRDEKGGLTSYFLAVLDNDADPDGNAAYGNSFVTNARFADAKFFYETDRRKTLAERVEALSHLQFQEKLGNYLDKTTRIERIARAVCEETGTGAEAVLAAARLCKADLVTEMVKEFTDLQGKVGGIYAREEGQPELVWQAIYDHYLPVNLDDALPRSAAGAVVSLADKMDTLAGFFAIGARPTGSKDPFALRRAAQGVVQILLNRDKRQLRIGIDRLVDIALDAHDRRDAAATRNDLLAFFADRMRTILEASAWGFAYDEIAATMEAGWASSLLDLVDRTTAVRQIRDESNFLSVLDSAKRIANITAGHDSAAVDPRLLKEPAEKRLNELAAAAGEQIDELVEGRQYRMALESFAAMAPELETFFKQVMVMVDDEAVRKNRMALLRRVGGVVMKIADVTKIVVDRRNYRS